jgi:hypothetical protein
MRDTERACCSATEQEEDEFALDELEGRGSLVELERGLLADCSC